MGFSLRRGGARPFANEALSLGGGTASGAIAGLEMRANPIERSRWRMPPRA